MANQPEVKPRNEVLTVITMKGTPLWVVMLCSSIEVHWQCEWTQVHPVHNITSLKNTLLKVLPGQNCIRPCRSYCYALQQTVLHSSDQGIQDAQDIQNAWMRSKMLIALYPNGRPRNRWENNTKVDISPLGLRFSGMGNSCASDSEQNYNVILR